MGIDDIINATKSVFEKTYTNYCDVKSIVFSKESNYVDIQSFVLKYNKLKCRYSMSLNSENGQTETVNIARDEIKIFMSEKYEIKQGDMFILDNGLKYFSGVPQLFHGHHQEIIISRDYYA